MCSLSLGQYPDVDIFAGDAVGGGNITISALSANNDDDLGNVKIDADEGVDIDTNDVTLNAAGVDIDTDDFTLNAGFVDIDAVGVDINADDVINLGAGNVNIGATNLLDIDSSKVDIATDDFTLDAGFVDIDADDSVDINAFGINLNAGAVTINTDDFTLNADGVDINTDDFALDASDTVVIGSSLGVTINTDDFTLNAGNDITLEAGGVGDVAVITNGGDFTVDGSTVVP